MPKKNNVHSIAHLLDLLVIPDPHLATVQVRGQKVMTPTQARAFAIEIMYAADEAEGNETIGDFGYASTDSQELGEIRMLIDAELGWEDDAQELDGDYAERVVQVGKLLRQRHLTLLVNR